MKHEEREQGHHQNHEGECGHHHDNGCCHHHGDEHDHEHMEAHDNFKNIKPGKGMKRNVYTLENLGCANCAAKMERKIRGLAWVHDAGISFPTKQLYVISEEDSDKYIHELEVVCKSVEDEVHIIPKGRKTNIHTLDERDNHQKQKNAISPVKKEVVQLVFLVLGTILFVGTEIYHKVSGKDDMGVLVILFLVTAYLLLGYRVLMTAFKNILRAKFFDENFLMSVATLGALAIGEYPEAVGVMLFYRVGELFEELAVEKSRSRIMEAVDLRPETAIVINGEAEKSIPAEEVKIGDVILVRPGDRIPVDGIIIEGKTRIDIAAITGEPVPRSAKEGAEVVSGCVNLSGVIKIKAQKELADSMVSRILATVEDAVAGKPRIDKFITKFSKVYTPVVVGIAFFTAFIIPIITAGDFYPWFYTALTFLVMSCPCALVLSVPLAFFCGIGTASQNGILFKGGVVMEAVSRIKMVVFDKTGTLTEGNFNVQKINCVTETTEEELLDVAAACERNSTHPIAMSIVAAHELLFNNSILGTGKDFSVSSKEEIAGKGVKAVLNKSDIGLCGNREFLEDNNIIVTDEDKSVGTKVYVAFNGRYIGNIVISDTVKSGAKEAVLEIKKLGIRTAMLTGDTAENANDVANNVGIDEVYAKLLPKDKLVNLQKLRENHGAVMFVGDGINDAPVLAGADVGAAMGNGSDAAIEAADVVFLNSKTDAVTEAFKVSKITTGIAMQNVIFAIFVKAIVMTFGLFGIYSNMWLAVFADTGVAFLCILNSVRILLKTR